MPKNAKTILFYLGHPAHYHNVKNLSKRLFNEENKVIYVARSKEVLFELIEEVPYKVYKLSKRKGNSKLSLFIEIIKRLMLLNSIIKKEKPQVMVGTDIVIMMLGKWKHIKTIMLNEDDASAVPYLAKYGMKYADIVASPNCCNIGTYEYKKAGYNGYHELAYLHPDVFKANENILDKYEIKKPFFLLRFSGLSAHHDKGIKGIEKHQALEIINYLSTIGKVFISSEKYMEPELEKFRINIHPKDMHDILSFSNMLISDSQTMTAEAAVLGVPSVRISDFKGKLSYLEELENQYQLTFGFKPVDFDKAFEKIKALAKEDLKIFKLKNKKMLENSENVNELWYNLIIK
ncbi:MAG: DUF354 domain-containing protein [Vicingaceae bacterium]